MANESVDGYLLLALLGVYDQQMGGPGFIVRSDQMRQAWQQTRDQPDHVGLFLEQLCDHIIAVCDRSGLAPDDPRVPRVDIDNGLVTFQIAKKTIRANLYRLCLEHLDGPYEELPQYITSYVKPLPE